MQPICSFIGLLWCNSRPSGSWGGGEHNLGPNIFVFDIHLSFFTYLPHTLHCYHYIYGYITVVKGSIILSNSMWTFFCLCIGMLYIMLCIIYYVILCDVMYIFYVWTKQISTFEGRIKMNLWTYELIWDQFLRYTQADKHVCVVS